MKKTFLILLVLVTFVSCESEREKQIKKINKESIEILSKITADMIVDGKMTDEQAKQIMDTFAKRSADSAELGYQFALRVKEWSSTVTQPVTNQQQNVSTDTTTFFDLKLVSKYNEYSFAKIVMELTNRYGKHCDKFWIEAEVRDKNGNYLGGKKNLMFDNIRPDKKMTDEANWENISASEIGEILLTPGTLEIEGTNYKFETQYIKILPNKFGVKVSF